MGRCDQEGRGVERAIRAALQDAGLEAGDVDSIWPNGGGLAYADKAERAALHRVFGDYRPSTCPKVVIGDAMGASGLLNVVLAVAARQGHSKATSDETALFISSSEGGSHVAIVLRLHGERMERSAI
jgi:3-oxoacyl-[acyl-carrier-protein] synthase II